MPFGVYAYLWRSTLMLVTPSTAKVHAGTSSRCGSTQPPMQASTWQRMPRAAARAATSATGSTTPWAYEGAEATTRTVVSSTAPAIAVGSARRVTGSTSTTTARTPRYFAALRKAACAEAGSTMLGDGTCGAPSRAASTASRIDSVPPEVAEPANPSGASRSAPAAATRSFSICCSDGKAVGSSPFDEAYIASASRPRASASASPES